MSLQAAQRERGEDREQGYGPVPDRREGGHVHRVGQELLVRSRIPSGCDARGGLQCDGQKDCRGRAVRLQRHNFCIWSNFIGKDPHHGGYARLRRYENLVNTNKSSNKIIESSKQ